MDRTALKTAVSTYGRRIDLAITRGDDVYDSKRIASCNISTDGEILTALMRQAEIELLEMEAPDSAQALKGAMISINLTVYGRVQAERNYGTFLVKDAVYNEESRSVSLTCYDEMLRAMTPYLPVTDFASPVTLGDYLEAVCTALGWKLATPSFHNSGVQLDGEKYDDSYTFRDVLTEIAQAAGGTIMVREGELYVLYPTDSGTTVEPDNLKTLEIGECYGPVNSVVLARTPQEDNLYKRDESATAWVEVRIENNQLMDSHRDDFLPELYDALCGLTLYPYELDSFGLLYLDPCDLFTLKTLKGEELTTMWLGSELEITQGLAESASLKTPTFTPTDYGAASTTDRLLKQTILRVNKQEQRIEGLVTNTETKVNELTNEVETISKKVEVAVTADEVDISIKKAVEGINEITTSTGYRFAADGMHVAREGDAIATAITNNGMSVAADDVDVLTARADGVNALNLTARQYLTIGTNSRFEDYEEDRTACFWIGETA